MAYSSKKTILIVDDEEINRAVLSAIFDDAYDIEEASDGQEAYEKIIQDPNAYIAILLDIWMPKMDGIEFLRKVDTFSLIEQIPIFLITSETNNDVLKEAYQLGVMDVISKPVIPYMIRRRVQSIIELFESRKQLSNTVNQQRVDIYEKAKKLEELNEGMIVALSTAIEFRSGESGEHVKRIHDITRMMLMETNLGEGLSLDEINNIALASIMHDVGKIAIPDRILNKPSRLTKEEYEIMKTHTTQGASLLDRIPQLKQHSIYPYAYDITLHHHERWDGNGYPDGLKGNEISIYAQIVSLADVYDALVSARVYKEAFTINYALDMIKNGDCGVFNPKLLSSFLEIEPKIRSIYTKQKGE